ncbi:slit protein [Plakobranchus ocellatus]|uniref:Slit protein n=1 Tax=Plakobranchus ocellatus TaxID=259542 RepID=A0AAV4DPT8_9GAST|nr:slit protein [Plakobranchus ocellatus]
MGNFAYISVYHRSLAQERKGEQRYLNIKRDPRQLCEHPVRSTSTGTCPPKCLCSSSDVDCKGRDLLEIPTQVPLFQGDLHLELEENNITKIPPGIFSKIKNVIVINLYNNDIEKIERDGFKGLMKLQALILGENMIQHIPKNIFNGAVFPQLKYLSLERNTLERIESETFCNLTRLTSIKLNNNSISYISKDAFKGLSNLTGLDLSGNLLTSAAWISGWKNPGSPKPHLDSVTLSHRWSSLAYARESLV